MATRITSSPFAHTDTATFVAWGKNISDSLAAVGLTKTADTGQIDWSTAVYNSTSTNTVVGYEIWRFNDALQATAPIFLKIEYGNGSAITRPAVFVTVGTGSNGAGTLTGVQTSRRSCINVLGTGNTSNFPSYFSYSAALGFLGVVGWAGVSSTGNAPAVGFLIARSCNDNGTPNAEGATLYSLAAPPIADMVSFGAATLLATGTQAYCMFPGAGTSTTVGSDVQLMKHYMTTPKIRPLAAILGYVNSEIGPGSPLSITAYGGTARTYLPVGSAGSHQMSATATSGHTFMMIWE